MTNVIYDWESVPNGGAATAANTGSTPNNPSPGTGGTIVGTTDADVGSRSLLFTNGTTAPCVLPLPMTSNVVQKISYCVKLPATLPVSTNYRLLALYAAGTARGYVIITPAGLMKAGGQAGSGEGNMASGGSISAYLGTYVRIEFDWNGGTTTTDGAIAARLYPTPFSTTQVGAAYSNTAINTGSGVITTMQLQIGVTATYAAVLPVTAGYLQINDGAVSNPGPAPSASAPSVNAGADQYPDAGTTITLTSTESGTFISATWSVTSSLPTGVATPSIASPASATTNVPLPNAGVFTFRRRLVWSGGNQDDLITAWVHPVSGQDIIVLGEFDASTAYNLDGSATSRTAALNDTSQSTGIASLDDPDGTAEKKFVLCPVGLGPINALTEGYARGGAIATRTITLYKEDGTTAVDSWTHTPGLEIASISETTDAVDSGGLTAVPALSDRRALVVGFKATV